MSDFDPISPLTPTWPARKTDDATQHRRRQPPPDERPRPSQPAQPAQPEDDSGAPHVDEYA